jgi:periplasmic divalent cation tolerance protein
MSNSIAIVYTTFSNKEQAKALIKPLVEQGMIACANLFAMESIYSWKDEVTCDAELVAILKTTPEKVNLLIDFLQANHPYEIPCILNWDVDGNKAYYDWVVKQTTV